MEFEEWKSTCNCQTTVFCCTVFSSVLPGHIYTLEKLLFYIFTVKNLFAFQTVIDLSQVERRKRFLLKRMP